MTGENPLIPAEPDPAGPRAVLDFWFGDAQPAGARQRRRRWFGKDCAFDAQIRARFAELHARAVAGLCADWQAEAHGALALVIVLDQFPRNMYRDTAAAYASDAAARAAAAQALARGQDRALSAPERMFLYLPFEHSESLADQRRAVELMDALAGHPETADAGEWARRHLAVIERFGRFPHRNAALGRASTGAEVEFLRQPGARF